MRKKNKISFSSESTSNYPIIIDSGYSKKEIYYKKKGNDIYFRLKDKLENAIANSKSLGQFDKENYIKSISEMWKFFDTEPIKTYFQSKITINN